MEWTSEPLCVDTQQPRFTWTCDGSFVQAGFELSVEGEDWRWTSGPQDGAQMYYQPDAPLGLRTMRPYRWTVRAWDARGRSLSGSSVFETGPMRPEDWVGKWIGDGLDKDTPQSPVLRTRFFSGDAVSYARLYLSAAAYADVYINGHRLCSSALNPGYTAYDKRNLYAAYDITDLLAENGRNEFLAILGCGFYNVIDHTAVWDFDRAAWRGRPRMLAQIYVVFKDGREYVIGSDTSWQALAADARNPYRGDNIYSGDLFDARQDGDLKALSVWGPARVEEAPSPVVRAQYMPLNTVEKTLEGRIRSEGDTLFTVAWPENIAGLSALRVEGAEGTVLSVSHGEKLDSAGHLTVAHMDEHFRPRPGHAFQTDTYILKEGWNDLRGRFCYHGFQYAQVRADRPVTLEGARAEFIHTAFRPAASFSCSDPELEAIREIVLRSYRSNYMGIPTDCPQREKNGWTADAHVSCEIGLLNFDVASSYLKWIDDLVDSQREDGQMPAIVPTHGWGLGIGPVWDAVLFILPETLYDYTGDLRAVRRVLPACERYLAWLEGRLSAEGTISYGLGDWCPWETETPNEYTSTCYYYLMNRTMARFKTLVGEDGAAYAARAAQVRQTINGRWFDAEKAIYANGSQCALGLALYLDLVPEGREADVAASLSAAVAATGGHLDYGMIGSKVVLRALTRYGYVDQAYALVKADTPSPAAWVRAGYTTALEQWADAPGRFLSMNHVFLGDVAAWMSADLAGIRPDPAAPGFAHVRIEPHFPAGLDRVEAAYDSPAGPISVRWKRRGGKIRLTLTLPGNVTAAVRAGDTVLEAGPGTHHYTI